MAKSVDEIKLYENAFSEDVFGIAVMHEAKELFGEKGFVLKVENSFGFRCKSFENRKVYIKEQNENYKYPQFLTRGILGKYNLRRGKTWR